MNDCLQTGPNYIPKLFNTLIKFRIHSVALVTDIEKAFLMIGISETDRIMLRFLWLEEPSNLNSKLIHLRFTRLVFGLCPSPAILGAVLSHCLETYKTEKPELVALIESSLYVDDLICEAEDEAQAFKCYSKSKNILAKAGMNLRKWNSNSSELMNRIQIVESSLQGSTTIPWSLSQFWRSSKLQFTILQENPESKLHLHYSL